MEKERCELLSCRHVLWLMMVFSMALLYFYINSGSIGVVSMLKVNNTLDQSDITWSTHQVAVVISSYYFFYGPGGVIGGTLARWYGTKLVLGLSLFIPALLYAPIPVLAKWDYRAMVTVRAIQGSMAGAVYPASNMIIANWVPPNDRSKYVSSLLGSALGGAVSSPFFGILVRHFGWESVFYSTAVIGCVWYCFWMALVYDSPAKHPRISSKEKECIQETIAGRVTEGKVRIPWKAILTSTPVWASVGAYWAVVWGLMLVNTTAAVYLKAVHRMEITHIGAVIGLGNFCRFSSSLILTPIADCFITKKFSRTKVRKVFSAISSLGVSCSLLLLSGSGSSAVGACACIVLCHFCCGAVAAGNLADLVDMSPNYAAVCLGISNGLGMCAGFLAPLLVDVVTNNDMESVEGWQKVYWISAGILGVLGTQYLIFGSSELQPWNSQAQSRDDYAPVTLIPSSYEMEVKEDTRKELQHNLE